jgi:hypothetical protein
MVQARASEPARDLDGVQETARRLLENASTRARVAVVAAALLVGGPVAAALLLRPGNSSAVPTLASSTAAPSPGAAVPNNVSSGFPAPPRGAVVFSREMGPDALALGVVPRPRAVLVQASVVGPQARGASGLDVRFAVGGAVAAGAACGPGCYRARLATRGRPTAVEVDVRDGPSPTRWRVALPADWPPRDATALLMGAEKAWRALRSLSFHERLGSGLQHIVTSDWRIQAPDRLAYEIVGSGAAVIIGDRRWDRQPGSASWAQSQQQPVTQPVPFWVSVTDAHVLGTATVQGRAVWRISFFDPGTPAWFTVSVDRATMRTLDLHMVTTAHFMHDAYDSFNAAPPVKPPS